MQKPEGKKKGKGFCEVKNLKSMEVCVKKKGFATEMNISKKNIWC